MKNRKNILNFLVFFRVLSVGLFYTTCYANQEVINNLNIQNANVETKDCSAEYKVNCLFSIGQNCKSAFHIQRCGKRFQAAPLDWMRDYSLDTCLHLFKNKFSDFFEEIKDEGSWPGEERRRSIKDTKNNILCIHHIIKANPIHEELKKFRKIMLNRADKVDKILNDSKSFALIYSQESENFSVPNDDVFIDFLKNFSKIYPDKKIYLAVITTDDNVIFKKQILFDENNLTIIRYTFLDEYNDPTKVYPARTLAWTGNHIAWNKVMDDFELVKT